MDVLTGPSLVVAALLVLAGAQKAIDPTMTVGALRALRLPAAPWSVRLGSVVELLLGVGALSVGSPVVWWSVVASYLAFVAIVVAALRSGTMIGTCGCFGREETPPHVSHVALNLALAGTAAAVAIGDTGPPIDQLSAEGGPVVLALSVLALWLVHALFVDLPRTLVAGRSGRLRQGDPALLAVPVELSGASTQTGGAV